MVSCEPREDVCTLFNLRGIFIHSVCRTLIDQQNTQAGDIVPLVECLPGTNEAWVQSKEQRGVLVYACHPCPVGIDAGGCLLWNIVLTRQRCATLVCAVDYYFNYVKVCDFCLCCLCLMMEGWAASVPPCLPKAPDWSSKKLNSQ